MSRYDAVVIGAGPNGLAAAVAIAKTGRKVIVFEGTDDIGGGCRSAELTLPGFVHDLCSAVHPFAVVSPFFRSLPLESYGLQWIAPAAMVAHPFDDGQVALIHHSIDRTAGELGDDGPAYRDLIGTCVDLWPQIDDAVLGPLSWPRRPLAMARFGIRALQPATMLARRSFKGEVARGLFAGIAAHAMLPLEMPPTGGVALALNTVAHIGGWCIPRGGARAITDALAGYLRTLGGEIVVGEAVTSIDELPTAEAILCDLSPRPLLRIAGHRFPPSFRRALERYTYGMGVCKIDWALDAPVPWRNPACGLAATVHLGGTLTDIAAAERDVWNGRNAERPFVLLSQPTLFDPSRAPAGKHIVWSYCHVPHGSDVDVTARIEQQIERFAPGFRQRVIARAVNGPADFERRNPNFVGGDIAGGATTLGQLFARPTWRTYSTPVRGLYICSASTPPGVGVHGMCGYHAAQRALGEVFRD